MICDVIVSGARFYVTVTVLADTIVENEIYKKDDQLSWRVAPQLIVRNLSVTNRADAENQISRFKITDAERAVSNALASGADQHHLKIYDVKSEDVGTWTYQLLRSNVQGGANPVTVSVNGSFAQFPSDEAYREGNLNNTRLLTGTASRSEN